MELQSGRQEREGGVEGNILGAHQRLELRIFLQVRQILEATLKVTSISFG